MNAAQISHIFWKEFRTQRSLWLAIVLLFLVTSSLTMIFLPEHYQPDTGSLLVAGLTTVAFYMLASTSILYASEKEQQADVFLRTLPVNPWLMLGVKCAWVLISSLLAVAIFSVAAYFLASPGYAAGEGPMTVLGIFAYLFCCSLVATLLTRHVFSAIGLSVALMLGGLFLEGYLRSIYWTSLQSGDGYFTVVILMLLATSLELNRRWFRESDWSWRGIRLSRSLSMRSALALPLEVEGSGRVWRRHLWRESLSARIWLFGIACFALTITIWFYPWPYQNYEAVELRFFLFSVSIVLVPLLIGVATCRADQAQQRYLFLGHRGDSAARVLLAKHVIWMSSALVLILFLQLLFWPDYSTFASHRQEEFSAGLRFVPVSSSLLSSARVQQLSGSMLPGIQFCVAVAFLLYCLGHFFSLLIVQPVMSLLSALFTGVFVTFLVCFFYALDVPLFVTAAAPAVCLLALSFSRGEGWINGDRSARSWKKLSFWFFLGAWTLVTLMAAWRVAEISWSTVIDASGLNNIPTYYFAGCAAGLFATLLVLLSSDWLRRNFSESSGRPVFGGRRWCTLAGVIGTFLVGHNLLLAAGLISASQHTNMLAEPMRRAVRNDAIGHRESAGDLYRTADKKISDAFPLPEEMLRGTFQQLRRTEEVRSLKAYYKWNSWSDVTAEQRLWLERNQNVLGLFFEADRRGVVESQVVLERSRGPKDAPDRLLVDQSHVANLDLILLVRLQALKLEHEGKLEESWQHHLAVVRYARRFADRNIPSMRSDVLRWLTTVMFNGDLWRWQARKEQTPELLARAADDLHHELTQLSPLAEAYKRLGGWSLQLADNFSTFELIANEQILATLPWERQRLQTLIVDSMNQNIQLAEKIDQGLVTTQNPLPTIDYGGEFLYWFQDSDWEDSGVRHAVILARGRNRPSPQLLVASWDFPAADAFADGEIRLPEAVQYAETTPLLMYSPKQTLSLINHPLADVLLKELDFWNGLSVWIGDCAIYSYRAETGVFPSHLGELHDADTTRELFTPLRERLGVGRAVLSSDSRRMGVSFAFSRQWADFHPNGPTYYYIWPHPGKWPQPEYNFGETPDRKPAAPLTAPKPEEVDP